MYSRALDLIEDEMSRQKVTYELIASENFVSENVLKALGSVLTNKYSEGYPAERTTGRRGRYYGGCEVVDQIEEYCCDLWKRVFQTDYHVNVQPHSGTQANMAAFAAFLKPGETILSMSLPDGGHLSHGSPYNFSGKLYRVVSYGLTEDGRIDYEDIRRKIREYHPMLVLAGASAYPREIDFGRIEEIIRVESADDPIYKATRPVFMVDMAHIAGLVAAGCHQSPFGLADVITTTTHKTLRGPRGGMIFCKPEFAERIDAAVFPGVQGGPAENVIAAKAVAAEEALDPSFITYIQNVVENAKAMSEEFIRLGFKVVTGGTDNHLFLLDFSETHPHVTGKQVQEALDELGVTLNKNCVPGDKRPPSETSGVRIGTAAETTRGEKKEGFVDAALFIANVINDVEADNKPAAGGSREVGTDE